MALDELDVPLDSEFKIDLFSLISLLWIKRKIIFFIVLGSAILSVGYSYILKESFLAKTTILPESEKSKISSLGGLSDIASLAGVNIGSEGSFVKLYPTIIKSETVLKSVIHKKFQTNSRSYPVNLIEYWELDSTSPDFQFENSLKILREELQISIDNKTSVITISISMPEPQLAADILNTITSELDKFIRNKKTTSAGEQRRFVEARLAEVKEELTNAENAVKIFREKNKQVLSPNLLLEQERLIRDVQINTVVYTELRKQFEIVKIEEVKNIPIITPLDTARAPAYKDRPKRSMILITAITVSFFGTIGFILIWHLIGSQFNGLIKKLKMLN